MAITPFRRKLATAAVAFAAVAGLSTNAVLTATGASAATTKPKGIDVSSYQGTVNWTSVKSKGYSFVYIRSSLGQHTTDSAFSRNYTGATKAGLIRGAYHVADPRSSGGAAQADFFVAHGGGWSGDGRTLPGALDLETETYWAGKTKAQAAAWIKAFSDEYHMKTGRYPVLYSSPSWWTAHVGTTVNFSTTNPLWLAHYTTGTPTVPKPWSYYSFWQHTSSKTGVVSGNVDENYWNGTAASLKTFATK